MLGKKSLAIALMGLGLAGSCFAAENSVQITFKATVEAATCPFNVTVDKTTFSVAAEDAKISTGNVYEIGSFATNVVPSTTRKTMKFALGCTGTNVPFNSVEIKHNLDNSAKVTTVDGKTTKSKFVFYSDETGDTLMETTFPLTASSSSYTAMKSVEFVPQAETDGTVVTGTHTADVTFTATYK